MDVEVGVEVHGKECKSLAVVSNDCMVQCGFGHAICYSLNAEISVWSDGQKPPLWKIRLTCVA